MVGYLVCFVLGVRMKEKEEASHEVILLWMDGGMKAR